MYSSIAAYSKVGDFMEQIFRIHGISIFQTRIGECDIKILLLYRKNDWPLRNFCEVLYYLTTAHEVDFIMGDFNTIPNEELYHILGDFKQLVMEPTHLAGAILDHVYVKKGMFLLHDIKLRVNSVFFSDHQMLKIEISKCSENV